MMKPRKICWKNSAWNWVLKDGVNSADKSLLEHMRAIPDYRCDREKPHDHAEMLTYLVAGYLNGRASVERALCWCEDNIEMLRKHMTLKKGIASEATISRMLNGIDVEMFMYAFMEWTAEILYEHGIHIIIDGKALKGAAEKIKNGNVPYILNAIDAATQMVIAQLPIDEKTNEITAIPKLLEILDIDGNTFTIDAIGTQKKIEEMIVSAGGHFILQVKKNNPSLYGEICDAFATFERELKCPEEEKAGELKKYLNQYDRWQGQEKNRERMEYRDMKVCTDASFLNCVREGSVGYIGTVGCMEQVRVPIEKDAEGNDITVGKKEYLEKGTVRKPRPEKSDNMDAEYQQVGMISDLVLNAKEMAKYKREHWKIENNLHHVLDDAFREDRSTAKGSKNNLSVIRKIAYNILRIVIIRDHPGWGIQRMMDYFSTHLELTEKMLFTPIPSFY